MLKLRGFVLAAVISAATVALWPAAGGARTLSGVVVARAHGTVLVASAAGRVRAVRGSAAIGSRITVAAGHATVVGRATRAHLRGIVLRHVGRTMFISSNHHLLALHSSDTTPAPPGTVISAQVDIANGELDEQDEDDVGQVANGTIAVQGTVTAVAAGSVTLSVGGQSLTVPLPAGLTLPASLVGQTVTIQVSLAGAGDDDQGDDEGDDDGGGGDG